VSLTAKREPSGSHRQLHQLCQCHESPWPENNQAVGRLLQSKAVSVSRTEGACMSDSVAHEHISHVQNQHAACCVLLDWQCQQAWWKCGLNVPTRNRQDRCETLGQERAHGFGTRLSPSTVVHRQLPQHKRVNIRHSQTLRRSRRAFETLSCAKRGACRSSAKARARALSSAALSGART